MRRILRRRDGAIVDAELREPVGQGDEGRSLSAGADLAVESGLQANDRLHFGGRLELASGGERGGGERQRHGQAVETLRRRHAASCGAKGGSEGSSDGAEK